MSSLYVHIPFCLSTCSYCSFTSFAGMETVYERYVQALKKEAVSLSFTQVVPPLSTLFLGGGTPTVLSGDQLGSIVEFCKNSFGLSGDAEISIEANPKSIDFMKFLSLKKSGVNRISIGVQSFVDDELQKLGRLHSAQDGWDAIRDAKSAGFSNISLDLMSGIPGQTPESWKWSLETAISLESQHLSLYQLSVEKGTYFDKLLQAGQLALPEEDDILAMDSITEELCAEAGLLQYEISNYAVPGKECLHNVNYWENRDYLAIGAGAVGYFDGDRVKNIGAPREYCQRIEKEESVISEQEHLDKMSSFRETVIMGLRMTRGVSVESLYRRYGMSLQDCYGELLETLISSGFLVFGESHLTLTKKGMRFANQVMSELV